MSVYRHRQRRDRRGLPLASLLPSQPFHRRGARGRRVLLDAAPAWADQTVMASDSSQVDCTASAQGPDADQLGRRRVRLGFEDLHRKSVGRFLGRQRARARGHLPVRARRLRPSGALLLRNEQARLCLQIRVPDRWRTGGPDVHLEPRDREGKRAAEHRSRLHRAVLRTRRSSWSRRCIRTASSMAMRCASARCGPSMSARSRSNGRGISRRGPTGRVLRIENKSDQAVDLTEAMVAPTSALAVSIAEPNASAGQGRPPPTSSRRPGSELMSLADFLKRKRATA